MFHNDFMLLTRTKIAVPRLHVSLQRQICLEAEEEERPGRRRIRTG